MRRPIAFTEATLVLPNGPVQATLRVGKGRILAIDSTPSPHDIVIPLPDHTIYPGLINAHDHLELNNLPRSKWRSVYPNAHQWGHDALAHLSEPDIATRMAVSLRHRLFFGGLKNLLSAVTTVAHHNPLFRPLRMPGYPVHVVRDYGWSHSLVFGDDVVGSFRRTPDHHPWVIHLAEGTDDIAAAELQELIGLGCLASNTILVHGVALSAKDRQQAIEAGAGLIWCPASNLFLLDNTGHVNDFANAKRLALGTDSRLTGSRDLLEEMKIAAQQSNLAARKLFDMVTIDAANLLHLENTGKIVIGATANLFVLRKGSNTNPYEALLKSRRADVQLLLVNGRLRLSSTSLASVWASRRTSYSPIQLDGQPKLMARSLVKRVRRLPIAEPGLELPTA